MFDRVFDNKARQQDVYEATAQRLLQGLLNGYNATVFAYGVSIALSCTSRPTQALYIYMTMAGLFQRIEDRRDEWNVEVMVTFLEICTPAPWSMSPNRPVPPRSPNSEKWPRSIIDLAGSECAAATTNMGQRMLERANINKSLLALGNCINALCESGGAVRHVPYRNSKLTHLLKFSLSPHPKALHPPAHQTAWPPNSPVFAQQLAHRPAMGPRRRRRRTRAPRLGPLLFRRHRPLLRLTDSILPLSSGLLPAITADLLAPLARLLASAAQPRQLLANMAEHAPLHHHLLTMPLSAKNRPPPALLSASAHYLALRMQLAAELPAYLALLHRGPTGGGERKGGGEETVGVWRARWGDVDNGVAGLRICRPLRGSSILGPAAAQLTPAEAVVRAYSEPAPINTESSSSPSSLAYANGGPPSPHYERNSRDREYSQRGEYSYRDSTSRNNRDSSGPSVHTNTSSTSSGKAAHVSNVLAALDPGLGGRRAPAHSNSMSSGYTSTTGAYGAASSSYATSMASGSPPPPTISGPFSLGSITGKPKGAGDGYSGTGASSLYAPSAYSYSPGAGAAPYSPGGERAGFAGWNENGSTGRGKSPARGASANGSSVASWALIAEPKISQDITWTAGKKDIRAKYGNNEVVVAFEPLTVSLLRGGKPQVVLNGRGLLHMEHFRNKKVEETKTEEAAPAPEEGAEDAAEQVVLQAEAEPEVNPRAWFEGETEDDWWEERFSTWTDSKPKGPESLSIDISFPSHGTIYGIPQHATRLALPTTAGDSPTFTDPYRLYNADVFEYLASSPMSLYGSIPVLHAHSADSTVGIFHAVGSKTWIDVSHASDKSTETHWISESGILDLFLMPGPTPADIFAYHQCRWNYISSEDIRTVQKRFDEEDMPYFMWDEKNFPDPVEMTNDVAANGGKMVVIVDPHLKRTSNYPAFQEASDRKVLVKQPNGESEYEGWCWSGSSSWIDFFDPNSWDWWKALFKTTALKSGWSWTSSTTDIHIWNDMNEPSVFNGPEISMLRDNIHYGGWEHRDVHNINGMLFSNLTSKAVQERTDPPQRPFVLTRSFFAGSQRFGAMWTGDNLGTWEHMAVGVQMVLANGIAGMSFAGSDVGGFSATPSRRCSFGGTRSGSSTPSSARTRTSTPSGTSRSSSSSRTRGLSRISCVSDTPCCPCGTHRVLERST
ncbi:glycosyl hydrolases family 31-domain-containing protein [Mycena olivaceomarginata]|nr:glycosyl hydrolases family 31-domain-containing protein [Mycena olivaceomarginata]